MKRVIVGLISDTHGLLRPQAVDALRGSDFIIHAGDVGDPAILQRLAEIAPLTAIRGNNDVDGAHANVPERAWLEVGSTRIYVLHTLAELNTATDWNATEGPVHAIVSGHSHKPLSERRDEVVYINPGSGGPRRFKLPVSVGKLLISDGHIDVRLIDLAV